jgi:hypothetical protein
MYDLLWRIQHNNGRRTNVVKKTPFKFANFADSIDKELDGLQCTGGKLDMSSA